MGEMKLELKVPTGHHAPKSSFHLTYDLNKDSSPSYSTGYSPRTVIHIIVTDLGFFPYDGVNALL